MISVGADGTEQADSSISAIRIHTLLRSVGEEGEDPMDVSEALRSASCLGPSGIAGMVLSPKNLWLWVAYFWWNGEGMLGLV